LALAEIVFETKHLSKIVCRKLTERFPHFVRGSRCGFFPLFQDKYADAGFNLFNCKASVSPARPPPVIITSYMLGFECMHGFSDGFF
jgi:hypothetical protein